MNIITTGKKRKKEIKEYNNYFKSFGCKNFSEFQELIGLTKVSVNNKDRDDWVRHQVCEEIREFVDDYPIKKISFDFCNDIEKKLGQIEQGEKNAKN